MTLPDHVFNQSITLQRFGGARSKHGDPAKKPVEPMKAWVRRFVREVRLADGTSRSSRFKVITPTALGIGDSIWIEGQNTFDKAAPMAVMETIEAESFDRGLKFFGYLVG